MAALRAVTQPPRSDMNVAVLLPPGSRFDDKLALMKAISRRVHRDVDFVDLGEAGLDWIREVLRDGYKLFDRNGTERWLGRPSG